MDRVKAKKLILFIIVFLIILLAGIGYAYIATDMFKSPKQLFVKYILNNVTQLSEFNFAPFDKAFEKMKENKTIIDVNIYNKEMTQAINYKYIGDLKSNKESLTLEILENDARVLGLDLAIANNKFGIHLEGVHDKFFALENRDLDKLYNSFTGDNSSIEIPNKIMFLENFSEEETKKLTELVKKYGNRFIEQFEDTIFTSEKGIQINIDEQTVQGNRYAFTTSSKKILEVFSNTISELTNDSEFVNLYNSKSASKNEIENLKKQNDELKKSIESPNFTDIPIVISVYVKDKRTIKTEISLNNNSKIMEFIIKDNNNMITKTTVKKSDSNQVGYVDKTNIINNYIENSGELIIQNYKTYNKEDIKSNENNSLGYENYYTENYEDINKTIKIQSTKNNDNVISKIIGVSDMEESSMDITMNIKFNSSENPVELTSDNALILNDYTNEDLNNLGNEILQNIYVTTQEHPEYYLSKLLMMFGITSESSEIYNPNEYSENFENTTEVLGNNPKSSGRIVNDAISDAIEKCLADYHTEEELNSDTDPSSFLTVDAIKSNCNQDMEIELIDGTTLKSILNDYTYYTKINIDGDTWELVETETLYSENGDLESAEPIE